MAWQGRRKAVVLRLGLVWRMAEELARAAATALCLRPWLTWEAMATVQERRRLEAVARPWATELTAVWERS